jgi:hypothetical protein
MAVARVSPSPKRTTSQPSSREIDATPAASAGHPQLGDLDQPRHRVGHRAVAVEDLLAERRQVAGERARARRR